MMNETDEWEDAQWKPLLSKGQRSTCWDDEDVDENTVKESWEDEDDTTLLPVEVPPPSKSTRKVASEANGKKGKIAAGKKEKQLNATEEKLCQLSLVEKADSGSTSDQMPKTCAEKSLDNFIPKSESDFLEYAGLISNTLRANEHSYYYLGLLKAVMRFSMKAIKAVGVKEVASSVEEVANEKLMEEREAHGRKRKTAASKKKKVYVEKLEDSTKVVAYAALDADAEYDST